MGGERRARRWPAIAVAASICFGLLGPVASMTEAGAQFPENATVLPGAMGETGAMVLDPATAHVFVSLPGVGKIAVLDFDGKLVKTITGEAGARGLAIVGSHLYVAATGAQAIHEIDTTTLTRTRTLASALVGVHTVAAAAGALWVIVAPPDTFGNLVRVSLADGSTTVYPNSPYSEPLVTLHPDPTDPDTLFELDPNSHGLARLDVSTDPPTFVASAGDLRNPDFAVSPDGATVIVPGDNQVSRQLHANTLLPTGLTFHAPDAEAVAMTAAAGGMVAFGDVGITIFRSDDPHQVLGTHGFNLQQGEIESGGLVFSPSGARLFVVTGRGDDENPSAFRVLAISGPPPPFTRLKLGPASSLGFKLQRVGTFGDGQTVTLTNTGATPVTLTGLSLTGANPVDFFGDTDCFPNGTPRVLAFGTGCKVTMYFGPLDLGPRSATLVVHDSAPGSPRSVALSGTGTEGYFIATARGGLASYGDAVWRGYLAQQPIAAPIVALATTPNGDGYWLLGRDGGVFTFGNAAFHGSTGALRLNRPVVGMTPTPSGRGYWLLASDGGIFSFGDAAFYGSTGAIHLNRPIVGMAATPTGRGYWLVASDGGIFSFGDAAFYGSTGAIHLNRPIVGMAASPTAHGYLLVADDGGVFAFGDAHFHGSAANTGAQIVGVAPTPAGRGYWMVSNTGRVFAYGDAPLYGDLTAVGATNVIGIASSAPLLPPELVKYAAATTGSARITPNAIRGLQDAGPVQDREQRIGERARVGRRQV